MPLFFFFFNDTATTEIYTLSLHDALPISHCREFRGVPRDLRQIHRRAPAGAPTFSDLINLSAGAAAVEQLLQRHSADRKSTRLNSSHGYISYAVFCLSTEKPDSDALLPIA